MPQRKIDKKCKECGSKNLTGVHAKYGKWEIITKVCLDCKWSWQERHRWKGSFTLVNEKPS